MPGLLRAFSYMRKELMYMLHINQPIRSPHVYIKIASTACLAHLPSYQAYRPSKHPTAVSEQTYLDICFAGTYQRHPHTLRPSEEEFIVRSICSSHEAILHEEVFICTSQGVLIFIIIFITRRILSHEVDLCLPL